MTRLLLFRYDLGDGNEDFHCQETNAVLVITGKVLEGIFSAYAFGLGINLIHELPIRYLASTSSTSRWNLQD